MTKPLEGKLYTEEIWEIINENYKKLGKFILGDTFVLPVHTSEKTHYLFEKKPSAEGCFINIIIMPRKSNKAYTLEYPLLRVDKNWRCHNPLNINPGMCELDSKINKLLPSINQSVQDILSAKEKENRSTWELLKGSLQFLKPCSKRKNGQKTQDEDSEGKEELTKKVHV